MRFLILLALYLGTCYGSNNNYGGEIVSINSGLSETIGNIFNKKIIGPVDENNRKSTKIRVAKLAEKFGIALEDNEPKVTNEENFVYPCEDLTDLDCIREFLADNSNCNKKYGPVPDPLYLLQNSIPRTAFNMSATISDSEFKGLAEAKIRDFFHNKVTDTVVLAIQIPALIVNCPKVFISFQRPGRESIVRSDFANGVYKCLIFTAILKKLPNLRLDTAEIHAYIPDAGPSFEVGPNIFNSTDPVVVETQAAFNAAFTTVYKENFAFQSQLLMATYIQSLLCNFDLELYSV